MNRRRLLWFSIPLVVLGVIVAAWFWMAQRDTDFHVIGPKTKGVRANFALLETTIDPADYRDCKAMGDAIARLNEKLRPQIIPPFENPWFVRRDWLRAEEPIVALSTLGSPFELPAATQPITLKQFIRMTYAQSGLPDVAFIVRGHYIEVTTAKHAQEERTRYFDSVSVYDRMHTFWKEMTGVVELDGPEPVILEIN